MLACNAVLQWVPDHQRLLLNWADLLAPGGWLAFQLPGNFDQPSHAIVRELAESPRWRTLLADAQLNRQAGDPAEYVELLARPGYEVDAWETSYLHILPGRTRCSSGPRGGRCGRCSRPLTPSRRRRSSASTRSDCGRLPAPRVRHHLPLPTRVHRGAQPGGLTVVLTVTSISDYSY